MSFVLTVPVMCYKGLHFRKAGRLMEIVQPLNYDVVAHYNGKVAIATSIIELLYLGVYEGDIISLHFAKEPPQDVKDSILKLLDKEDEEDCILGIPKDALADDYRDHVITEDTLPKYY